MGDTFHNIGAHAVIVNRSKLSSALNSVAARHGPGNERALEEIVALVEASGSTGAAVCLERFLDGLGQSPPERSTLSTLWRDMVVLVPALAQLPAAVAFIAGVLGTS